MVQFNEKRSTQAAAEFLKKAGGKLNYMVLIKFLYLADREALLKWGTPITGDTYLSMRWGPLLSRTHDLITEEFPQDEAAASFWKRHIEQQNFDVILRQDPGTDELSDADEGLIAAIFDGYFPKYRELKFNPFEFCDFLHTILPEYKTAEAGQSFSLDHHDILVAGKKAPEEIRKVETLLASIGQMQKLR
jgi:hypothetical protein